MTAADQPTGSYAWLDGGTIRTASDASLGCILLLAGSIAVWNSRGVSFGNWEEIGAGFFPLVVGTAMLAIGVLLLARAVFFRRPSPAPWGLRNVAIVVAVLVAVAVAAWWWRFEWLLSFGPPEHMAAIVLILAAAIALARRSRVQAIGMMLLGLLLNSVGLDSITGQLRLTMGVEQLFEGFATPIVFLGLVVAADGLICVVSPSWWLATYAWVEPRWRKAAVPTAVAMVARLVAALAVAAACYFALIFNGRMWEVGVILALGVVGVAAKLFGWNRLVLVLACAYGNVLEQSMRYTMLMSQGDPTIFFARPISAALMSASLGLVALTILLAALGDRSRRQALP